MTTISTLPTAPSRADPTTFVARSDALLGALDGFVSQTNLVAGEVNTNAATATTQAALATTNGAAQVALATTQAALATTNGATQVALATTQAVNAATSATAAAGSALTAGAVAWVSGTTYALGDTRYSPINFQTYRRTTTGAGTTDPSIDTTNWTLALKAGITNVVAATGMTTLTSTATLLSITPTAYGIAVTLPDATTCPLGGPLHKIDNRGAYPVRLLNSTGALIGFVFAGVTSDVSLVNNSTAAGVWDVSNVELVGASAQLLTNSFGNIDACIDVGSGQEVLLGRNGSSNVVGIVYNRATNTFGAATVIRATAVNAGPVAVLSAANQVLVCSTTTAGAFEGVAISISGTTITVNAAATATLSANFSSWADGCGLIAVGSSFVTSYMVTTPAAQIRALSISGTTVTIGAATVLDGTASGLIAASGNVVIAVSTATNTAYTRPYTVSGSTLSAGTGTSTVWGTTAVIYKFFALGTRWGVLGFDTGGTSTVQYGVVSLSGTTTTITTASHGGSGALADAIVVGANKVLVLSANTVNNANILTDTAGTASAGTAITLSSQTNRACAYVIGTDVVVGETAGYMHVVSCAGASPVKTTTRRGVNSGTNALGFYNASNSVLSRSPVQIYGTGFAQVIDNAQSTDIAALRFQGNSLTYQSLNYNPMSGFNLYRGKSDSERWISDSATVITKVECVQ